jgi:hypothetical protein
MSIQAIETKYNGYRFRSRLEARWAVFFDTLGIRYEYEKEGYDLGEYGMYLPDFWLPENNIFIEIKGKMPTEDERAKAIELSLGSGFPVAIISNECWYESPMWMFKHMGRTNDDHYSYFIAGGKAFRFTICHTCLKFSISGKINGKIYSYCLNETCMHSLLNANPNQALEQFRPKRIFGNDGWIEISSESLSYMQGMKAVDTAYIAARSARFEHGETPKVQRGRIKKGK